MPEILKNLVRERSIGAHKSKLEMLVELLTTTCRVEYASHRDNRSEPIIGSNGQDCTRVTGGIMRLHFDLELVSSI